jgi:hypothetical protein
MEPVVPELIDERGFPRCDGQPKLVEGQRRTDPLHHAGVARRRLERAGEADIADERLAEDPVRETEQATVVGSDQRFERGRITTLSSPDEVFFHRSFAAGSVASAPSKVMGRRAAGISRIQASGPSRVALPRPREPERPRCRRPAEIDYRSESSNRRAWIDRVTPVRQPERRWAWPRSERRGQRLCRPPNPHPDLICSIIVEFSSWLPARSVALLPVPTARAFQPRSGTGDRREVPDVVAGRSVALLPIPTGRAVSDAPVQGARSSAEAARQAVATRDRRSIPRSSMSPAMTRARRTRSRSRVIVLAIQSM